MNRIPRRESSSAAAAPAVGTGLAQRRLGRNIGGGVPQRDNGDEGLDLFSKMRRSQVVSSPDESVDSGEKSEGLLIGSSKIGRRPMDDLLSSETGKHDYDWLLTPPGTPLFSSSEASENQFSSASARSSSNVRSSLTSKVSRLSVAQSDNGPSTRPTRSSSVTRASISSIHSSSHFSGINRASMLNTSTTSMTSRPSTPGNRPTSSSSSRTLAPTARAVPSRTSSAVAKTLPTRSSTVDKPGAAQRSRPSTPTSRPQISSNSSSVSSTLASRSSSRPSTPTRRTPASAPSVVTAPVRSSSVGLASTTSSRIPGPASRPSSPAPRARASVHPIIPPDFPLDAPPNLRTKLPERAISAGRTRPGMALTVRSNLNSEPIVPPSTNRRSASPSVSRGRFPENTPKAGSHSNGHEAAPPDVQKASAPDTAVRRAAKLMPSTESTGFGRTISKKSLDMALRHMDIRQNIGGIRGASLFPQSIHSTSKSRPLRMSDPTIPSLANRIGTMSENGRTASRESNGSASENGDSVTKSPDRESLAARASEPDISGSYRYDTILLKEDSRNMNWLHSVEDKSDQSPDFDHPFEQLPEPFGIL